MGIFITLRLQVRKCAGWGVMPPGKLKLIEYSMVWIYQGDDRYNPVL